MLCECALRAISLLTKDHKENQLRFAEVDAPCYVMKAIRLYDSSHRIVYFSLQCIASLSAGCERNTQSFSEMGVVKTLLPCFEKWMKESAVAEAICYAIFAMKPLNKALGQEGACEVKLFNCILP